MLPGPVFNVELLTMARRKVTYVIRFLYGLLLLFLISQSAPGYLRLFEDVDFETTELTIQQLANIGSMMFTTFAWTQAVIVLAITPALVAGVIADEKQRKTLHYLLASTLTSAEIVLGKLFARMLGLAVLLAVGLPILTLLSLFGGVDPNEVLLFIGACFTTSFFLGALALLVSVHAKRPRDAVSMVYLLEAVWLVGPTFTRALMPSAGTFWSEVYRWIQPANDWVGASSPLFVFMNSLLSGARTGAAAGSAAYWMAGLQVAFGLSFVALAVLRLRPEYRRENSGPGRFSLQVARRARRILPRPPCGDDGLLWKERYVSRTGPAVKILGGLIALVVLGFLGYWTYQAAAPTLRDALSYGYGASSSSPQFLNGFLRGVMTLFYVCWLLATASASSSAITHEREEDTWVSLISTPLNATEMVRAKLFGAFWSPRLAGVVWGILLLVGLVCGGIHPIGALGATLYAAVTVAFCDALGLYLSLRSKNSMRALTGTVAVLVFCNLAYLVFFMPFPMDSTIRLLGITPLVQVISLASYEDVRGLFEGWSRSGPTDFRNVDLFLTYLVSLVVYGGATLFLLYRVVDRFDDVHDRPRTDGRGRRRTTPPRSAREETPAGSEKQVGATEEV